MHWTPIRFATITGWCGVISFPVVGRHIFYNDWRESVIANAEICGGVPQKHGFLHAPPMHAKCMVPEGELPHPIQRRYSWILCRTLFEDDLFPDSRTFLASTVSGPDGLWYAKGFCFADTSNKAWGTEDKYSGRNCCYFTGRATEGNALTYISRVNKLLLAKEVTWHCFLYMWHSCICFWYFYMIVLSLALLL